MRDNALYLLGQYSLRVPRRRAKWLLRETICLALKHGVAVGPILIITISKGSAGAAVNMSREELRSSLLYQVGALKSMTESLGGRLVHV